MQQLFLIETLGNGIRHTHALSQLSAITAQKNASYAVIDISSGKTPAGLKLIRESHALNVIVNDETVVQIYAFYNAEVQAQFSTEGAATDEILISSVDPEANTITGASSGDTPGALTQNSWLALSIVGGVAGTGIIYNSVTDEGNDGFNHGLNDEVNDGLNDEVNDGLNDEVDDLIPPAAPDMPDLTTDSGRSDNDDLTNIHAPTFSGIAEANSIVTLTSSIDGIVGTTIANINGNWSITANVLTEGDHNLTATSTDSAGNISTPSTALTIKADFAAPTLTFTNASYDAASDTITLIGIDVNTLLTGSETSATDLKASIDWSKLQWDVNSDDVSNITFAESDINSAKATDNSTLTIILSGTKAAALESALGFDNLTKNDTLEITAGFALDTAGNIATSDAYISTNASIVIFDLITGISSDHSGRVFSSDISYTIFLMVDSNSTALLSAPLWSGGENLGADDRIILTGNMSPVLGTKGNEVRSISAYHAVPINPDYAAAYYSASYFIDSAHWKTGSDGFAGHLFATGVFYRGSSVVTIFAGEPSILPSINVLQTLPAGVYTSQGLGLSTLINAANSSL